MSLSPEGLERFQARIGTLVRAKYRLDWLLGVGGMAAVFAATHRNGSRVALKVLHPELARLTDVRARFLREGYVANRIAHPGALRVIDDDDDDEQSTVFLVVELLEGESLSTRVERLGGRLPLEETLLFADRVLDVLAVAHDAGIVHRDVKPDNLFLTTQGELKVLDFGIARLLDGTGATRSGQLLGTPAFMSPEQANGRVRDVDGQSDLWSVGALMFALLTGEHVHPAPHSAEQLIYAATQPARPIGAIAPWLARDVAAIIDRALSFDKAARWPDARAMQEGLRATRAYDVLAMTTVAPAHRDVEVPVSVQTLASAVRPSSPQATVVRGSSTLATDSEPFELRRKREGGDRGP